MPNFEALEQLPEPTMPHETQRGDTITFCLLFVNGPGNNPHPRISYQGQTWKFVKSNSDWMEATYEAEK